MIISKVESSRVGLRSNYYLVADFLRRFQFVWKGVDGICFFSPLCFERLSVIHENFLSFFRTVKIIQKWWNVFLNAMIDSVEIVTNARGSCISWPAPHRAGRRWRQMYVHRHRGHLQAGAAARSCGAIWPQWSRCSGQCRLRPRLQYRPPVPAPHASGRHDVGDQVGSISWNRLAYCCITSALPCATYAYLSMHGSNKEHTITWRNTKIDMWR